jgi:WD40 repeat protein
MKNLYLFLFVLKTLFISAQNTHLVINPEGHRAQVRALELSADGKYFYTGGFDKTIKIWETSTGQYTGELLSQIGIGSEGMIYALAASPDGKWLAVGGWLGANDESEPIGDIRIFNLQTRRIEHVIKHHVNAVYALKYSPDSRFLFSGDAEGEFIQWEAETGKKVLQYANKDKIEVLSIDIHQDNIVTSDTEGGVKLWKQGKAKPLKTDQSLKGIQAHCARFAPDGKTIAACGDKFVVFYNEKLQAQSFFENENNPHFCEFSPDGKFIFLGTLTHGEKHVMNVLHKPGEEWIKHSYYNDFTDAVYAGKFVSNSDFIVAGGDLNEIVRFSIEKPNSPLKVVYKKHGKGKAIYAASLVDKEIAYADKWTENFGMSAYNKQFSLALMDFVSPVEKLAWKRPATTQKEYSLERKRMGREVADLNSGLIIKKNNVAVDSIIRNYWDGSRHNVFTLAENKTKPVIISGGSYGTLSAYSIRGFELTRFVGHEGDVWGATLSVDGQRLISCGSDGMIKIWDLSSVGIPNKDAEVKSIWDNVVDKNARKTFFQLFEILKVDELGKQPSAEAWKIIIQKLHDYDYSILANYFEKELHLQLVNYVYPIVSIFITADGEWIIWNNEGYFMSSKKGAKYVGYHLNQGKNKEAKYYPFEQFDIKYNRPDIILKDLAMAPQGVIDGYYLAYKRRLKKMGLKEEDLAADIHLPELIISNYDLNNGIAQISLQATDKKYPLDRLFVYINDVPVYGTKGKKVSGSSLSENLSIPLANGKNKVQVSVLNKKGQESLKETIWLTNNQEAPSKLFVLSIGVSQYKDKKFNLNYAAKDALDVAATLSKTKQFASVEVKTLTDKEVTRENVLKLKESWLGKANIDDMVIVFFAGHGVLDKELDYYFAAHDIDFMNPAEKGISYTEIESLMDGIKPLKKLLFMDSCHSGELEKDDVELAVVTKIDDGDIAFRNVGSVGVVAKKGIGLSQASELASNVFLDLRKGTGTTVISSAGGAEFALESGQWKNGLFTFCLLNGISSGAADMNNDGKIYISELQKYVGEQVLLLSGGNQKPTYRRENLEFDYRIW